MTSTFLVGLLAPAVAFAQDEPVSLNWALWDWNSVAYYQPLIDAYEAEHPNVTIEYTDLGAADFPQMLMTQLTGGADDIDIVSIKDIPSYAQLISTDRLVDLTGAYDEPVDPAPYGGLLEELTVDGGLYGLPFRADFWLVYYNKDLFDAAGVDYPTNDWTWDEFYEKARALTSGFGADKVYGAHFHTWRSTVELPAIMDGENTLIAEDYSFLAPWYESVLALQEEGAVQSYGALKTSQTHYSGPFYNEQIAMLPMGSWFIGTQINKVDSGESLSENWGIASYPHPEGVAPGTTAATITSLGVNANSAHQEAALDFIRWVASPEGAAIIAKTGTLPAIRDDAVIETIASNPGFPQDENSRDALRTTQTYLELPVDLQAAEIELVLNRAHDNIMTGNVSVEDGIAEMNAGVQDILD
ncbi:ABC transporter substrate-binding protein [Pelagibacterium halotolerans]|uniref:ABC transporter substrate-binding protein n=1 Tax=Pelagibacterium halotolerans TaxID=531813 RepID=UPI00384D3F23